ncbi:hypothetical protein ScPMuIL_013553 [Solemya velum]
MAGLITLLVFSALTLTMVLAGRSPKRCDHEYRRCMSLGNEKFECDSRKLQCLYKYCQTSMKQNKVKSIPLAVRLAACLGRYSIPSPMWFD